MQFMKTILPFVCLFCWDKFLTAQTNDTLLHPDSFIRLLYGTIAHKNDENFLIQTDRPWYFEKDSIWFNVRITTNRQPYSHNNVLYVDLADSSGKIFLKKILFVDSNSYTSGVFALPEILKPGWYSFRAYTQLSKNFIGSNEKLIYVTTRDKTPPSFIISKKGNTGRLIDFFPEGGTFVNTLSGRMAFIAKDESGKPAVVKGFVVNNSKDTLANFQSGPEGLGVFSLDPFEPGDLIAKAQWPDGKITAHELPGYKTEGLILQASVQDEKLYYKVESTPEYAKDAGWYIILAVMHNEIIYSKILGNSDSLERYINSFSLKYVPEGIITLVIFKKGGETVAARNVFHKNNALKVDLDPEEINFNPKAKNSFFLQIPDSINAILSVSVSDADLSRSVFPAQNNMAEFQNMETEKSNAQIIDILMITDTANQNHSFDFQNSFRNPYPEFLQERGITVKGRVKEDKGHSAFSGKTINIFSKVKGPDFVFLSDTLSADGSFEFNNLFFTDTSCFYWKVNGGKTDKYQLETRPSDFDTISSRQTILSLLKIRESANDDTFPKETLVKYRKLDSLSGKKGVLKEVTVYTKHRSRIEELDNTYAGASIFGGKLGYVYAYDLDEEKGYYSNIFSYLLSRIPGLTASGYYQNPILNFRAPRSGKTNVAVFLNDTRIDASFVATILVSEIVYVKVFRPPFSYLLITDNSSLVIAIYTRKGIKKEIEDKSSSGLRSFCKTGFSVSPDFTHPDYSKANGIENLFDKRITLYWNPVLEVVNGKAKIEFYNNDFTKKFLIRVKGISKSGEVISFEKEIIKVPN